MSKPITINPPQEEEDPLEQAWFTNSYPQHSHSVSDLTTALKIGAITMITFEVITSCVLATKAFQFVSIQTTLNTDVVQLGTLVHLFSSFMQIAAAFSVHNHATHITERTPQNTQILSRFLNLVTAISVLVGVVTMMLLNSHGVPKMPSFFRISLVALVHFGFKILTKKEEQIPRIIDLNAHSQ